MLRKDMQKEIKKYQGSIYYYEQSTREILPANWVQCLADYNHNEFELHHVVPFTDWEKNIKNVREKVGKNALILISKVMHQHLENPMYKLSKSDFQRVYGINPDLILYDVNSKIERSCNVFFLKTSGGNSLLPPISFVDFELTEDDLSCFDGIEKEVCNV